MNNREIDDLFEENEIFKEHFDNRVEKWIKGLHLGRISELEASSASHTEKINKINVLYFDKKSSFGYTQFYNRTHKEIAELREKLDALIERWGNNSEDQIIEHYDQQIAELRKHCDALNDINGEAIDSNADKLNELKEVLRNHIKAHKHKEEKGKEVLARGVLLNTWLAHLNNTLEKLDSQRKTEKKEVDYGAWAKDMEEKQELQIVDGHVNFGEHVDENETRKAVANMHGYNLPIKASGGEQLVEVLDKKRRNPVISEISQGASTDSKPPEPKYKNYLDYEDELESLPIAKLHQEPREDEPYKKDRRCLKQKHMNTKGCNSIDYKYQNCISCDYNPEERVRDATRIVKREKIEFWRKELLKKQKNLLK